MKAKRLLSLLLVMLMVFAILPTAVSAESIIVEINDPNKDAEINSEVDEPDPAEIYVEIESPNYSISADINHINYYQFAWYREKWEGQGTRSDPYLIQNAGNLRRMAVLAEEGNNYSGCYFKLTADIDLSEFCGGDAGSWTPIGTGGNSFKGKFNGDGHTISGLYINEEEKDELGLFGKNLGNISDLTVEGSVTGNEQIGGVAGYNGRNAVISGCTNKCSVTSKGSYAGGLTGFNEIASVTGCRNEGTIQCGYRAAGGIDGFSAGFDSCNTNTGTVTSNDRYAGGICGFHELHGFLYLCENSGAVNGIVCGGVAGFSDCKITQCNNSGTISGPGSSNSGGTGGICGRNETNVTKCRNTGAVNGQHDTGGITGSAEGEVSDCVNDGEVSGGNATGGIAGFTFSGGNVKNCTNHGIIRGRGDTGGVVGWPRKWVEKCINTGKVEGSNNTGGIVGYTNGSMTSRCINSGEISGGLCTGGIAGYAAYNSNKDMIKGCYNIAAVNGSEDVGGVAGLAEMSYVEECSNIGKVTSSGINAGGVVGHQSLGSIFNCHNSGEVRSEDISGGIVGRLYEANVIHTVSGGKVYSKGTSAGVIGERVGDSRIDYNYYIEDSGPSTGIGKETPKNYSDEEVLALDRNQYRHNTGNVAYKYWDFIKVWDLTDYGPKLLNLGPYETNGVVSVSSAGDLRWFSEAVSIGYDFKGCTINLEADIDLSGGEFMPIGDERVFSDVIFSGVFNGNGHTISGLNVNSGRKYAGLFGIVNGTIKDVTVSGSVSGKSTVGGIAALVLKGGTLENCSFSGSVSGSDNVGGIAGLLNESEMRGCIFNGEANCGGNYTGGLAGLNNGTVERCSVTGGAVNGSNYTGGLVGYSGGVIKNCFHTGTVTAETSNCVGGIAGEKYNGTIIDCCHYKGAVTGLLNVGGIAGKNSKNNSAADRYGVKDCYYLTGTVVEYYRPQMDLDLRDVGLGVNFTENSTENDRNPGGAATPLTLAAFKKQSSFSGWDFDTAWSMGSEHPVVSRFGVKVSFDANGGSGVMNSVSVQSYGTVLPACGFTRSGYDFIGWNTSPDATGDYYSDGSKASFGEPVTLYAVWAVKESVAYIDADGNAQTAEACFGLSPELGKLQSGSYFVSGTVNLTRRLETEGDIKLILKDGATLNAPSGIHVPEGSTLTVFGQSGKYDVPGNGVKTQGTGVLNAQNLTALNTSGNSAAIGGDADETPGEIILCGGVINATAQNGAAIGGAKEQSGGTLSIFNACVIARGGNGSAAVGGGFNGNGGAVEISGGYLSATGSVVTQNGKKYAAPGIGAGAPEVLEDGVSSLTGASVSVRNATVHAQAGEAGSDGVAAGAIGTNNSNDYDLGMIYPLLHVRVNDESGNPIDQGRIPWFCTRQSVDLVPCTSHRGRDDDPNRCRYCGATDETGVIFVVCDYNYADSPAPFSYGVEPGDSVRITSRVYRPGDTYFTGWNTKKDGSGTSFIPGQVITPAQSMTLYAQWQEKVETTYTNLGKTETVRAIPLSAEMTALYDGWYLADGRVQLDAKLAVQGDVKLILADGCEMNAASGIIVPKDSSLTVYGQSGNYTVPGTDVQTRGTGALNATGSGGSAAIGGEKNSTAGNISVCGGVITANGSGGAGIGAGEAGKCGSINITGGCVHASGADGSAGIGGGAYADNGTVYLIGGYIYAEGGSRGGFAAAGIGAGAPDENSTKPTSAGTTLVIGSTVIAKAGSVPSGGTRAQAIGVNLRDSGSGGNLYSVNIYRQMRAYNAPNAQQPVAFEQLGTVCDGEYVKIEYCRNHDVADGHCIFCGVETSNELHLSGSGAEDDPYLISSASGWNELARYISSGGVTEGLYFKQVSDISVTEMVGPSNHPFKGVYDGAGHTLTFNAENAPAYCAAFRYLENATVRNLNTAGTITTSNKFAGGLAVYAQGTTTIEGCRSSVVINSSVNGDGTHGGIAAIVPTGSNVTISKCVFDGELTGTKTAKSGGFVGYTKNCTLTVKDSLLAPCKFEFTNSQNFVRTGDNTVLNIQNSYHLDVTAANSNQGKNAHAAYGEGIGLTLAGSSGVTFYDVLFAAAGEELRFTSSLGTTALFASSGTLTRDGHVFTLMMPDEDVSIRKLSTVYFAVKYDDHPEGGILNTNANEAFPGSTVKLIVKADSGYVFDSVAVTDSIGDAVSVAKESENVYSFIMPADDVNVSAVYLKKYSFNSETGELRLLRGEFNDNAYDRWAADDSRLAILTKSITSEPGVRFVGDCSALFWGFKNCETIDLGNVDTSDTTGIYGLFHGCSSLTSVNLDGWDVSSLEDISYLFEGCTSLTSMTFPDWSEAPISDMSYLFSGCTSLTSADISGLTLSDTEGMFSGANKLSELTVAGGASVTEGMLLNNNGGWIAEGTQNVVGDEGQYAAFNAVCDTAFHRATDVLGPKYTFDSASGALTLNWGTFNVNNTWDYKTVSFAGIRSVTAGQGVRFTGNCAGLFNTLYNCESMELSNVDTQGMTDMSEMFVNCESLTELDLSGWDTSQVTNMSHAFDNCEKLKSLDLAGWNTSLVSDFGYMFNECEELTALDLSCFDTGSARTFDSMFFGCRSLESLNLTGWNTSNVNTMVYMFCDCESLVSLNISGWNTSSVTNMGQMFCDCSALTSLDLSGFRTENVYNMSYMFAGCTSLVSLNLTGWSLSSIDGESINFGLGIPGMFSEADALCSLTVSPEFSVTEDMSLNNGGASHQGWIVLSDTTKTVVSGDGEAAVIAAPESVTTYVWKTAEAHSVTVSSDAAQGGASADKETAFAGEVVTLSPAPKDGYVFKEWQVISGGVTVDAANRFVMSDKDAEIRAVFEAACPVVTDGNVTVYRRTGAGEEAAGYALPGELLRIELNSGAVPAEGKYFTGQISVNGSLLANGADTFTMPAEGAAVAAIQADREALIVGLPGSVPAEIPVQAYRLLTRDLNTTVDAETGAVLLDLNSDGAPDLSLTLTDDGTVCTARRLTTAGASGSFEYAFKENTDRYGTVTFITASAGDVNLDGRINIRDVTAIQRYFAEIENLTDVQLALADINGDGVNDITDATCLQMYLAEYTAAFGNKS